MIFERVDTWLGRFEGRLVVLILALGVSMRLIWIQLKPIERLGPHESEMWKAAVAFSKTGLVQDAYAPGSGISSHVGPAGTMLAGFIYRWFGVGSPLSESIMAVAATIVAAGLFFMLYRLAVELKIPLIPRLVALSVVSLLPINFYTEVIDFRIREAALGTFLTTAGLVWLLRLDRQNELNYNNIIKFGLLAAITFLINPVFSLALYSGLGLVALRQLPVIRWPASFAILVCALLAVNGAWIVRNYNVYDRLMISRGNFGLELATANHPAAADPADARAVFNARMKEVHPAFSASALARLKTFPNDAAYFDAVGKEARTWIVENPSAFMKTSLRHLSELYFPPQWQWDLYNNSPKRYVDIRQSFKAVITVLALCMLVIGLVQRTRPWLFVTLTIVFPTALYMVVQPTLRYRYTFEGLFVFLAVALVWRLCTAFGHPARPREH